VHLAGLGLKRRFGLPWVADFRDPWMALEMRVPPTAWHRRRQVAMERAVLETSDVVLAASRTHAERAGARSGARPRAVVHLPNGFEPAPAPETLATRADRFTLAFTGTLSQMPETETLLEALHALFARHPEARRRVRARLAGPYDTDLADRAVALGLTGIVEFAGALPHAATRALQGSADALLLWKPPGLPAMVPGKLYEYLDSGRPIVALLEASDEAAALVERGGGTVLPPGDREALAAWIEARYAAWREAGRAPSRRPEWLDEHRRDRLAARLAGTLDRLCAGVGP
jgi:glycosyltransferase involved in cell wall biosynthesis